MRAILMVFKVAILISAALGVRGRFNTVLIPAEVKPRLGFGYAQILLPPVWVYAHVRVYVHVYVYVYVYVQ